MSGHSLNCTRIFGKRHSISYLLQLWAQSAHVSLQQHKYFKIHTWRSANRSVGMISFHQNSWVNRGGWCQGKCATRTTFLRVNFNVSWSYLSTYMFDSLRTPPPPLLPAQRMSCTICPSFVTPVYLVYSIWSVSIIHYWCSLSKQKHRIEETQDFIGTRDFKDVKALRILLCGPVGAGKSSFINSANSVLQGKIMSLATTDAVTAETFTRKVWNEEHFSS